MQATVVNVPSPSSSCGACERQTQARRARRVPGVAAIARGNVVLAQPSRKRGVRAVPQIARLLFSSPSWESTRGGASRLAGVSAPGSHNPSIERTSKARFASFRPPLMSNVRQRNMPHALPPTPLLPVRPLRHRGAVSWAVSRNWACPRFRPSRRTSVAAHGNGVGEKTVGPSTLSFNQTGRLLLQAVSKLGALWPARWVQRWRCGKSWVLPPNWYCSVSRVRSFKICPAANVNPGTALLWRGAERWSSVGFGLVGRSPLRA